MVRIGEREMVRIQLAREQDGRWRETDSGEMPRLAVWRFDPKLCISVPAGSQTMTILDPSERFVQIGTLDWSRDADFVRRIIRSLTRVEAGEDKALRQFAEALGRFADSLQRGASPPQAVDSRIAQEILRIRNLASMLSDQQDLLGAYYEALRDDPEVKSVLETKIAAVAQQTVESERKILIKKLTAELEQDFAALRAERWNRRWAGHAPSSIPKFRAWRIGVPRCSGRWNCWGSASASCRPRSKRFRPRRRTSWKPWSACARSARRRSANRRKISAPG